MKAEPEGSTLATVSSVTNGPSTLGERVRSARRAAGLSQAQLAGDELTKGFISQVEAGLVRPSIRSLQVIAGRLGRSLDYFVGDESLTAAKRATFHRLAADAAAERSDWQASETQARAGLASTTDPAERGRFFRLLGAAALYQGRREEAFDHVAAGLALLDPAKHAFDVARLLYLRASAYAETGQSVARFVKARPSLLGFGHIWYPKAADLSSAVADDAAKITQLMAKKNLIFNLRPAQLFKPLTNRRDC